MPPVAVRNTSRGRAADSNWRKRTPDEISLIVLQKVLRRYEIPEAYYSLNGNADSCVCLSKENGVWQVFIGDRGKKRELSSYQEAKEACADVIRRVGDKKIRDEMLLVFFKDLSSLLYVAASNSYSYRSYNQRDLYRLLRMYARAPAEAKVELEK